MLPSRDWYLALDLIGREDGATNPRAYLKNAKVVQILQRSDTQLDSALNFQFDIDQFEVVLACI